MRIRILTPTARPATLDVDTKFQITHYSPHIHHGGGGAVLQ